MGVLLVMCRYKKGAFVVAWIILILAMSGCERKNINDILVDPSRYANQEVVVAGNVVRSVSVLGAGAYELDDGTGKLWVVSKSGVPREGAKVLVTGTVKDGYNLSAIVKLPNLISSGLALIEKSHQAR
jgi:hypothetical protein